MNPHKNFRTTLSSISAKASLEEPLEYIIKSFQAFTKHKLAGTILLLLATAVAIFWANSWFSESYGHVIELQAEIGIGTFVVKKDLLHWINDGLMGIFFFVVGLEIKREMLAGELSSFRKASLPFMAAVGGMVVPALIYFLLNRSGIAAKGWGIPMATDIAFALGVLALLGSRIPSSLKIFLTALAIVDDIGAVLVIALFYTDNIEIASLAIAGVLLLVSVIANFSGIKYSIFYFVIGTLVWLAFLKSGVHATLAAVLMALTIPSRTRADSTVFVHKMDKCLSAFKQTGYTSEKKLLTQDQIHIISSMEEALENSTPPLQRLEHALMPLVTFVVLPIFALANAGVRVSGNIVSALQDPICLGVIFGLFLGKPFGIFGFTWLAVKLRIAALPSTFGWRQVFAVAILGGIGFTMSLFIGGLAFQQHLEKLEVVKIGILAASALAGVCGWSLLHFWTPNSKLK